MIIAGVWLTSALYSIPKFIFVHTVDNDLGDGKVESICIINRKMYDSKLFDFINFGILYMIPLLVISVSSGHSQTVPVPMKSLLSASALGFHCLVPWEVVQIAAMTVIIPPTLSIDCRSCTVASRWPCGGAAVAWNDTSPYKIRQCCRTEAVATARTRTALAAISRRCTRTEPRQPPPTTTSLTTISTSGRQANRRGDKKLGQRVSR